MSELSKIEVRRETTIEATPAEVWEALTEEEQLAEWLAADVELELAEGGEGRFVFEDGAVESDLAGAPTAAATAALWVAKLGALRAMLALVPA